MRDLGSTNGTVVGDLEVVCGFVRSGARIRIGNTIVTATVLDDEIAHPLGPSDRFGELIDASPAMRSLYPLLDRCATSEASVLIQGETGTGKELVAEAIHLASGRRSRPFVVVDCGALPHQLIESELFGQVRGAFTGADIDRVGAFDQAAGGTVFLDEIGEPALELQPVLLRVLEAKTIRRVGESRAAGRGWVERLLASHGHNVSSITRGEDGAQSPARARSATRPRAPSDSHGDDTDDE